MKKTLLAVSLLGVVGGLLITSCQKDNNQEKEMMDSKESSALRLASGLSLIDTTGETQLFSLNQYVTFDDKDNDDLKDQDNDDNDDDKEDDDKLPTNEEITDILFTIDGLLEQGFRVNSTIEEGEFVINGTTYTFKETVSYSVIGEEALYEVYYNLTNEKVDHHDDLDDDDDDKDEIEEERSFEGIAISGDKTYKVKSEDSVEKEDDETETSRELLLEIDSKNYIKIEETIEIEDNEKSHEFEYTLVENGDVTNEFSIEIEHEDNKKVEFEKNGIEYEVEKINKDGQELYKVEIENDDNEVEHFYKKIENEDGTISYEKQ